jgi:hypothetical protein
VARQQRVALSTQRPHHSLHSNTKNRTAHRQDFKDTEQQSTDMWTCISRVQHAAAPPQPAQQNNMIRGIGMYFTPLYDVHQAWHAEREHRKPAASRAQHAAALPQPAQQHINIEQHIVITFKTHRTAIN